MKKDFTVDENMIAAFLDGRTDVCETAAVLRAARKDEGLRDYLLFSQELDGGGGVPGSIPCFVAASDTDGSLCCIKCEQYVMRTLGHSCELNELAEKAMSRGWLRKNGTPLLNIGRLCEDAGLQITRKIEATLEDIESALSRHHQVIVMLDGGELSGDHEAEIMEDITVGEIPDHTVVVLLCSRESGEVTCFDPINGNMAISVPISSFMEAWEDSKRYMVTIR